MATRFSAGLGRGSWVSLWICDPRHHVASGSMYSVKEPSPAVSLDPSTHTSAREVEEFTLVARVLWGFQECREQVEAEFDIGRAKIPGIKTFLPVEQ